MKKLVAVLAAALALAGCGAPVEGVVTSKKVEPARTWVWLMPTYTTQCYGAGATRTCTQVQTGVIPVQQYAPECPELKVRDEEGETHEVCVSRDEYERIEIGAHYKEVED